jgi:hypothetical protein
MIVSAAGIGKRLFVVVAAKDQSDSAFGALGISTLTAPVAAATPGAPTSLARSSRSGSTA